MIQKTNEELIGYILSAPNLKDPTKKSYVASLRHWMKTVHPDLSELLSHPDVYGPKLQATKDTTRVTLYQSIIALMKHSNIKTTHPDLYDKWYKNHFAPAAEVTNARFNAFEQTDQTKAAQISWTQIIDCYNKISRSSPYSLEHLTLAMYTLIPPRRQMDYWKLVIIHPEADDSGSKEGNISGYLDLRQSPATLTVLSYKTEKKYKEYTARIPDALDKIIRRNIDGRGGSKVKYLFETASGKAFSNHESFTSRNNRILKKVLGHEGASVNVLRHAASTWVFYNNKMTPLDKQKYAAAMGHSYDMQSHYAVDT